MTYRRTATFALPDDARAREARLAGAPTTDSQWERRHLQLLHLPDERERTDDRTETRLSRYDVYEVVVRDPRNVVSYDGTPRPVSPVVERHGPHDRERAFARATALADERDLPVYAGIVRLRPDIWTDPTDWFACPTCGSETVTLITDFDETGLVLVCRSCDARADETERGALFEDWFHCPSCASGDVNVELSVPGGHSHWSCDDCLYDTAPKPVDHGYSAVREG